jgi:hypothetical protein
MRFATLAIAFFEYSVGSRYWNWMFSRFGRPH